MSNCRAVFTFLYQCFRGVCNILSIYILLPSFLSVIERSRACTSLGCPLVCTWVIFAQGSASSIGHPNCCANRSISEMVKLGTGMATDRWYTEYGGWGYWVVYVDLWLTILHHFPVPYKPQHLSLLHTSATLEVASPSHQGQCWPVQDWLLTSIARCCRSWSICPDFIFACEISAKAMMSRL